MIHTFGEELYSYGCAALAFSSALLLIRLSHFVSELTKDLSASLKRGHKI